jgi:hypothetical protein
MSFEPVGKEKSATPVTVRPSPTREADTQRAPREGDPSRADGQRLDLSQVRVHSEVQEAARLGTGGPSRQLPHLVEIQRSFGRHDVRQIAAHVGREATAGAGQMGAAAFTFGERVAFARPPTLETAAHEAAHVIQQRSGVHVPGGVGKSGDVYEQQADRVAEQVRQGRSSETLLGERVGIAAPSVAVQMQPEEHEHRDQPKTSTPKPETAEEKQNRLVQEKLDAPLSADEQAEIAKQLQKGFLWSTSPYHQTLDPDRNAVLIAGAIAADRVKHDDQVLSVRLWDRPDRAAAEPRLKKLLENVQALGSEHLVNLTLFSETDRKLYVMDQLVTKYGMTPEGAAGLAGNMFTESALLPNMVEGGQRGDESKNIPSKPMNALDENKKRRDFSAEEVAAGKPKAFRDNGTSYTAGIGLAQWSFKRREALLKFEYQGKVLGKDILFNTNAQLAFAKSEMEDETAYPGLDKNLSTSKDATASADKVMEGFERPQPGTKKSRENAAFNLLQLYKKHIEEKTKEKPPGSGG